jgi:outer membrane lipoprotein SlyB
MQLPSKIAALVLTLLIAACTTMPTGPTVMVLPGTGKSFDQFRADDMMCRNYALESVGGLTASQSAAQSGVSSAVVGTVIGAAAGAAIGGHEGAGVGAGTGLVVGGLAGTGTAQASGYDLQYRYDHGYIQCMYAKGHQVPVSGSIYRQSRPATYALPPSSSYIPPPPAGMPPPPPPGVVAP